MPAGLLTAWLVEIGLITWRDVQKGSTGNIAGLPLPADYLATFGIFGGLGLLAEAPQAKTFAGVVAWGYVIATYLGAFSKVTGGTTTSSPQSQKQTAINATPTNN